MMLPPETIELVLSSLDAPTIARVLTTCNAINTIVESLLLNRISERGRRRETDAFHTHLEQDPYHSGFYTQAAYLNWLEWIASLLEDESDSKRKEALEILRTLQPAQLNYYAAAVVRIACNDEDIHVKLTALRTLGQLDPNVLAAYGGEIEQMLSHEIELTITNENQIVEMQDADMSTHIQRLAAQRARLVRLARTTMRTLCKIDPAIIERIMLEHADSDMREIALHTLGVNTYLQPAMLQQHAAAIVHVMQDDEDPRVKLAALQTLHELDGEMMQPYITEIENLLTVNVPGMMMTAMRALCKIDPAIVVRIMIEYQDYPTKKMALLIMSEVDDPSVLIAYADHIAQNLYDDELCALALHTLHRLDSAALATYAGRIAEKLKNHAIRVRKYATEILGKLEPRELEQYAYRIAENLRDTHHTVRWSALQTMNKLNANVLERYTSDLVNALRDTDQSVCRMALQTLEKLDPVMLERAHGIGAADLYARRMELM